MLKKSTFAALLSLLVIANSLTGAAPRVFSMDNWFQAPDGTSLSPMFNPKDCMSNLPWDLTDNFSVAVGEIEEEASIVCHPVVTQLTFVLSGKLKVIMKEKDEAVPSTYFVEANQAILIKPGACFQLLNGGDEPCRVLYIVSPAYLFEMDDDGRVVYDDAVLFLPDWDLLEMCGWDIISPLRMKYYIEDRNASYDRLALRKKQQEE